MIRFVVLFQPVHQISQTFIHTFNQRCVCGFFVTKSFSDIFGEEAHILVNRNMDSVMRHIQIEGLIVLFGFIQGFDGFTCQGFRSKYTGSPIIFQTGDSHQ